MGVLYRFRQKIKLFNLLLRSKWWESRIILVLLLIEWVAFRGFLNSPLERGQGCVLFYNNRHTHRHFVTPLSRGDSIHGKQLEIIKFSYWANFTTFAFQNKRLLSQGLNSPRPLFCKDKISFKGSKKSQGQKVEWSNHERSTDHGQPTTDHDNLSPIGVDSILYSVKFIEHCFVLLFIRKKIFQEILLHH